MEGDEEEDERRRERDNKRRVTKRIRVDKYKRKGWQEKSRKMENNGKMK